MNDEPTRPTTIVTDVTPKGEAFTAWVEPRGSIGYGEMEAFAAGWDAAGARLPAVERERDLARRANGEMALVWCEDQDHIAGLNVKLAEAGADVDQARRHADEVHARYVDLQDKSSQWLKEANDRAVKVERERDDAIRTSAEVAGNARGEIDVLTIQRDDAVTALADLLAAVDTLTLSDPTHYEVATAVGLPAGVARQLVERYQRPAAGSPEPSGS